MVDKATPQKGASRIHLQPTLGFGSSQAPPSRLKCQSRECGAHVILENDVFWISLERRRMPVCRDAYLRWISIGAGTVRKRHRKDDMANPAQLSLPFRAEMSRDTLLDEQKARIIGFSPPNRKVPAVRLFTNPITAL